MKNNIKISVIIPVYNTEVELFNRAIRSIDFNCEIIVVNDGSDPKYDYVAPGARFINLKENKGILHARKIGVENATGDWILFLDSDDFFNSSVKEWIEDSLDKLDMTDEYIGFVYTNDTIDLKSILENKDLKISPFVTDKLWRKSFLKNVFSNEVFDNDENISLGEDTIIVIVSLLTIKLNAEYIAICKDGIPYFRDVSHTSSKLSTNSSYDEVQKVWGSLSPLRTKILLLKMFYEDCQFNLGLTDSDWDRFSFRLCTCKFSNVNTDIISKVTGKKVTRKTVNKALVQRVLDTIYDIGNGDNTTICGNCKYSGCIFDENQCQCYKSIFEMIDNCNNKQCDCFEERYNNHIDLSKCNTFDEEFFDSDDLLETSDEPVSKKKKKQLKSPKIDLPLLKKCIDLLKSYFTYENSICKNCSNAALDQDEENIIGCSYCSDFIEACAENDCSRFEPNYEFNEEFGDTYEYNRWLDGDGPFPSDPTSLKDYLNKNRS